MPDYQLFVRDQYFNRVAEIENFQSITMKPAFNAVGAFELVLPTNSKATQYILSPQAGIIVVRNGTTIFSGPINQRARKWSVQDDLLTISGYDDNFYLQSRLALPNVQGNNDYDVRTGPCESIMKQYVSYNMGVNASGDRKINLTPEVDQARGTTITGRARYQNLLELCGSLALQGGGLGFKVVQSGNGLQFQVYQPIDKTTSVIFSPLLGNLLDFDYTDVNPESNYLIAAGTGTGAARAMYSGGDNDSIAAYGRVEGFLDKRDTSDQNELIQAVSEGLKTQSNQTTLNITPVDTDAVQFVRDYTLGDKVSVVLTKPDQIVSEEQLYFYISAFQTSLVSIEITKDIQSVFDIIQDVVRQVTITIDINGETITPAIGTADSVNRSSIRIFSKMKTINRRLSNLERV